MGDVSVNYPFLPMRLSDSIYKSTIITERKIRKLVSLEYGLGNFTEELYGVSRKVLEIDPMFIILVKNSSAKRKLLDSFPP